MYLHALIWGNSPSTTLTWLFRFDFPSHPCSHYCHFSFFAVRTTRGKARFPERAPLPNQPTPAALRPPHLSLIPCQGKRHAAPSHVVACRWRNVSLTLHKIFSPCTHLVLPSLLPQPAPVIPPPRGVDMTDGWPIYPWNHQMHPDLQSSITFSNGDAT